MVSNNDITIHGYTEKSQEQDKNRVLIEQTKDTRFKPGESGNKGGRPKGQSLTAVLRELLEQIPKGDTAKLKERIVKALLDKALRGDTRALDIVFDRTDGKVSLPVELQGEMTVTINVGSEKAKELTERLVGGERTE